MDVEDGIPEQPIKLLMEGKGRPLPGVYGTVANESVVFIYLAFGQNGMSTDLYHVFLLDAFPLHYSAVLTQYPPTLGGNASMAAAYLATDMLFTCSTRAMIRAQSKLAPSFLYKFQVCLFVLLCCLSLQPYKAPVVVCKSWMGRFARNGLFLLVCIFAQFVLDSIHCYNVTCHAGKIMKQNSDFFFFNT